MQDFSFRAYLHASLLIVFSAPLTATALFAEQAPEQTVVTFEQAARNTLRAHPQFQHFVLALDAARTRETQAGLKPALELSSELENVLGSGSVSGAKGAELTVSLTSVFERGNKRAARLGIAQSQRELLSVQQRIEALDLITETGRNFIALAAAQESKASAERALLLADKTLAAIKQRVAAAQAPETEQLNAEIVQVEAMLQIDHAKRRVEAVQHALALDWNTPHAAPRAKLDLYTMRAPADAATMQAKLDSLPDIAQYSAQTRAAKADLDLRRAQAIADWRWSAGVRRLEAQNDQAFVLGLSIPLGTATRQSSFTREAEITAQLPDLAERSARIRLKTLLFTTLKDMNSAISEAHAVRDQQLPLALKVQKLTMQGYELGRYAYRDVALAAAQVQILELKGLNAAQAYHLARIELERLTGAQLNLLSE